MLGLSFIILKFYVFFCKRARPDYLRVVLANSDKDTSASGANACRAIYNRHNNDKCGGKCFNYSFHLSLFLRMLEFWSDIAYRWTKRPIYTV